MKVFGKVHPIPRQQSAYGDPGVVYTYSGTKIPALAWTPTLQGLRDSLETIAGVRWVTTRCSGNFIGNCFAGITLFLSTDIKMVTIKWVTIKMMRRSLTQVFQ